MDGPTSCSNIPVHHDSAETLPKFSLTLPPPSVSSFSIRPRFETVFLYFHHVSRLATTVPAFRAGVTWDPPLLYILFNAVCFSSHRQVKWFTRNAKDYTEKYGAALTPLILAGVSAHKCVLDGEVRGSPWKWRAEEPGGGGYLGVRLGGQVKEAGA